MTELSWTLMLLILLGLLAAGLLGYRRGQASRKRRPGSLQQEYFIGLNYLLNDEPDEAIDTFIAALEVNARSLETHVALGTLLRRRGRVDQSITLYQELLGKTGLERDELNRIKVELVRSYIAAGLLDRAERLLEELKGARLEIRQQALALSVSLFEKERDWMAAAERARALLKICPSHQRGRYLVMASHYHCELAEQALAAGQPQQARRQLRQAISLHRDSARASLMLGQLEYAEGNYRESIKTLLRIRYQDAAFLADAFMPLLEAYQSAGGDKALDNFIRDSLKDQPVATILVGVANLIQAREGSPQARAFLLEHLQNTPSLKLIERLLAMLSQEAGEWQEPLLAMHEAIAAYLQEKPSYQCHNCGYQARKLHWQCPGCAEWETIRPITGMLGE